MAKTARKRNTTRTLNTESIASSSTTKNQDSQQNLTVTTRGRKRKNASAGTITQLQEATTSINQLPPKEIVTTRAESSQSAVNLKRKPDNDQIIEASDNTTEAITSNSSCKRRKIAEDNNNEEVEKEEMQTDNQDQSENQNNKKRTKRKKPKPDKRKAKIRSACPAPIRERIDRAASQRIYMINRKTINKTAQEFSIIGSTGNVYTVTISHVPNCTCQDFLKGFLCKHIMFVYLRVCRLSKDSTYIYQKALVSKELISIFSNSVPDPAAMANRRVRNCYLAFTSGKTAKLLEKRRPIEGDCPICYEPLEEKDRAKIKWCQECGNNIHKDCFLQWVRSKHGHRVTCVYCRSRWRERLVAVVNEDGYVNLSRVQKIYSYPN